MKVVVNSYDLAEAVNKVAKAVATRDSNGKILEGIKLVANNEQLTLTAFDSEMSIETTIKCDSLVDGEMVVAGKIFAEYVNKVASADSELEIKQEPNNQAKVTCGKVKFVLSAMEAKSFPILYKSEEENSFEVEVKNFKKAVSQTAFCCATDESRPILKGCLIEVKGENYLNISALDGFRLGVVKTKIKNVIGDIKGVVPARALLEMARLISAEEDSIKIVMDRNHLILNTENTSFSARLLNGQFVDCERLLKGDYDKTITANRAELISALDRMSIIARTANNLIGLSFLGDTLKLTTNNEIGNIEEEIEIEKVGNDAKIALNFKYLLDILKAIDEEEVKIYVNTESTPLFIKSKENGNFDYLIMPVRMGR